MRFFVLSIAYQQYCWYETHVGQHAGYMQAHWAGSTQQQAFLVRLEREVHEEEREGGFTSRIQKLLHRKRDANAFRSANYMVREDMHAWGWIVEEALKSTNASSRVMLARGFAVGLLALVLQLVFSWPQPLGNQISLHLVPGLARRILRAPLLGILLL